MKNIIVFSHHKDGGSWKLEGQGYSTVGEAERYITLFEAREKALAEVNKKWLPNSNYNFNLDKEYFVKVVNKE